jgi:hypothetical protein
MLWLRQGFQGRQFRFGLHLSVTTQMSRFYPFPTQNPGNQKAAVAVNRVLLAA